MKTKFRTLAVLCYVFSLSMPFLHAQDCIVFAGNDTLICDYSHALKGTPLGGTWELVCAESAGIAAFEVLNDSITTATVSECGLYTLVYNIDVTDCVGTDTIRIEFDDPDKRIDTIRSTETISYIVECHEPPPSSCTAVVTIGGQNPPEVEWNICSQVNCTTFEYEQNVIGTPIGCLADSISTDTTTTSDQGAQVCATASQAEIIDGYFDIAGGVSGEAFANASCPFPIDDCPDLGDCRDTMYLDTIFKVIPIRIGGAWTYQDEDGTFQAMNDTTFYTQNNNNFAITLEPGADYYGPDDLTATFYGVDENGVLVPPVGSGGLTIQWQEIWDYDTLMQEAMVTEPLGSCCPNYIIVSSGEGPTPPDFPCGPIDLGFNSPPEYDDEFFFMCIQDFIVLVTDAPSTATVTWNGPGGFDAGSNSWGIDGFEIGPGTHEFIATITDGDCVSTQRFIVDVFEDFIFIEFSYPPSCTEDGEILPEINNFGSFVSNYFFSASGGLSIDSNTGAIDSNGATPGTYTVFLEAFGECSEFFTETEITISETPEAIIQVSDIITCFNTSVTLDGSASTGEEFSWSNGLGNSPVVNVSSAGAYTLTVTTGQCFDEVTVGVDEDTEAPVAVIAEASLDCFNMMTTLDASGSSVGTEFAYSFTTIDGNIVSGENTLNPLIDQAGTYELTVFNLNNGCEESATITVENESMPTAVTLQVQLDCNSQSEVIEVCSGLIISPNDINNPYFCEDENGCPIEVTVLIEEDVSAPIVDNVQTICNADNTAYIVDFEVSGTDDYTIESIHPFEEIPSCDEYQFIITGNNGCSTFIEGSHCCDCTSQAGEFSDISIVSCDDCVAAIYIDDNQVLDANDVLQFLFHTEAAPAMGDILAISDEPIFCFDEATMTYNTPYYITAQVGNNDGNDSVSPDDDCAAFSESFVTSWSDIATLTELEESICAGNCFTYHDSTLCETGVYTFVLENSLGCDSMVRLTLSPTDDMLLDWTSEAACFNSNNGMIRLDNVTGGTPPYLYSKDGENFQTEATFHDLAAGEHLFYIQDSEGCMLELGLDVPEIPEMNISPHTTTHICGSEAALLNATPTNVDSMSVTYEWQDGSTKATFSAPVAGTYWVEVSNACQTIRQELSVINDFVPIEDRIYVPNAFSPNGDEENDFFKPYTHVELMNYQFHVFDRWGNLLFYSENIKDIGWDGWFEGKVMNPAVMVWWLTADAMTCTGDMESVMMKGDVTIVR